MNNEIPELSGLLSIDRFVVSRRRALIGMAAAAVTAGFGNAVTAASAAAAPPEPASANGTRFVLDMVQNNPGEAPVVSAFCDPRRLADWGYSGQVVDSLIEGISTFDAVAPGILAEGSKERAWADARTKVIAGQIKAAHAAGVKCYAWMQVLVLPKGVVEKFKSEICDARGHIDIHLARTQELFRAQLREIFERLPDLDGFTIRTGEIYLQDLPYHTATGAGNGGLIQGSTAILHAEQSHTDLVTILRDEVCAKRDKTVIYRTWDFGNNFHVNPAYYQRVADAVEPHANLVFSMKHQAGDFHQLTPFNPTIGIGRHRQLIEVQCQREGYGKGAHPYYVGQGVIDGWEEYAWMMKPGQPKGLRDVANSPQFAGVWTWSRGGGWDGPYITNEFWCELNAFVVAKFAEDPTRTEADIFAEFERKIGLTGDDVARFRELCLLSAKAVLRGQLTTLGAKIDLWWARDDTLSAPDLKDFVAKGLVDKALAEKREAVQMWMKIEELSRQITFADAGTRDFVVTSCAYGRIKYAIIEQGWTILFLGRAGDAAGSYDKPKLAGAIVGYDQLWNEWKKLKASDAACSTLPKDLARGDKPGIGAAVEKYRTVVGMAGK
jgi:hypothetical protein